MATYVVGAILAVALFFALRHVFNNFRSGKNDCCGNSIGSCGGSCAGCHGRH
ncbi:MAG: FeoB-associated Cys-rich membrane protein [Selenomonas sp.]|uniref:FeoB-associated Cys-rich membrane protein n=1 Tax=Selenomonas sp. TaxID=2053611 RepID=UPI0025FFA90D|nr:FeoB-associated Cys-rich membrane protein [Selenomonas sp.]MCR5757919.1 FeoB-associated Cys-rich membrane protein [Selenomonas sp.]